MIPSSKLEIILGIPTYIQNHLTLYLFHLNNANLIISSHYNIIDLADHYWRANHRTSSPSKTLGSRMTCISFWLLANYWLWKLLTKPSLSIVRSSDSHVVANDYLDAFPAYIIDKCPFKALPL